MQITPSNGTLQALDRSLNASPPTGPVRQSAANELAARSTAVEPQMVNAAQAKEAAPRPEADSRPPAQASGQQDRPGSRLNLLV
jgi:hypothetical protein